MDISRETLDRLYTTERKSLAEIGLLYGKHKTQVRRWLIREAIPIRSVSEGTSIAQKGKSVSEERREALRIILRQKADPAKTAETFAKISASNKGRVAPNKGKKWTPEERAAHAYRQTPEYRAKLSAAQPKGEKHHNSSVRRLLRCSDGGGLADIGHTLGGASGLVGA